MQSSQWKLLARERAERERGLKLDFSLDAGDSPLKSPRLSQWRCIRDVHVSFCLINLKRAYFFFGCGLSLLSTLYSQITRESVAYLLICFWGGGGGVFFFSFFLPFRFSYFTNVQLGNIPRNATRKGLRIEEYLSM